MPFSSNIHLVDQAIVVGYIAIVLVWGLWLGRAQRSTEDYFLGGRSLPWWAILLSIVATETSTVTFLSIPGITFAKFHGDFRFLQITFGYIAGRILVALVLLPLFFRGQVFTSYEVLQSRFGVTTRRGASILFLLTRNVSDALRLFLTALALQQATGLALSHCVIALGIVTIIYTLVGGAKAVVWNDCLQFAVYMLGAAATLVVIATRLPGGMEQILDYGSELEKFRLLDFRLGLEKPMSFWAGLVGGIFLTAATHGTDQLMVQRYLSARDKQSASWALVLSGFVVCVQFALFLTIGVALACFYDSQVAQTTGENISNDGIFAHFIVNELGIGLVGITLAAVFAAAMSTLSSSLNSSATALVNDIYLPLTKAELTPKQQLRISRIATLFFGFLQIAIAIASQSFGFDESTVGQVLKIAGFALGPVLGMYLLAVFYPQLDEPAALIGFCAGIGILSVIAYQTPLYWPWYALCGAVAVIECGLVVDFVFDQFRTEPKRTM